MAAAALASALALAPGRRPSRSAHRRRLPQPSVADRSAGGRRRGPLAGAGAASGLVCWLVWGPAGLVLIVFAGLVVLVRHRRRWHRAPDGDPALVLDVLAGCLASGARPGDALAAAATAAGAHVGPVLRMAADGLARGDDPEPTWAEVGRQVPQLAEAARHCVRAARSGAPLAAELHRLATAERARRDAARRAAVQRASVWLVLPLGLCFLPAFVLVGVVPVVLAALPRLAG